MVKKYLLMAGQEYYSGGPSDIKGVFDDVDAAINATKDYNVCHGYAEYWMVIDLENLTCVAKSDNECYGCDDYEIGEKIC